MLMEMLNKKILASDRCYSNYCHSSKNLKFYETACNEVFLNIRKYLNQGNLSSKLKGPVKQIGFYKTKYLRKLIN